MYPGKGGIHIQSGAQIGVACTKHSLALLTPALYMYVLCYYDTWPQFHFIYNESQCTIRILCKLSVIIH